MFADVVYLDGLAVPVAPAGAIESHDEAPPRKRGGGPKTEEGKLASRRNALKDGTRAR